MSPTRCSARNRSARPAPEDEGFSLVEMLVATALTLLVTGAVFALVDPSSATSQVLPEATDMQQRLRAGLDAVAVELELAGAGLSTGPNAGPLGSFFAAVIPRRIGLQGADPPSTARADAITILSVPVTYAQTTVAAAAPLAGSLMVNQASNCPAGTSACGFEAGMPVVLFDRSAHFDLFTVTGVTNGAAAVQARLPTSGYTYAAGAPVAEVQTHVYYRDSTTNQLRHYDGYQTDVPVVDNIVNLAFEYFGSPEPPVLPKPAAGTDNCLYDSGGTLRPATNFGGAAGSLVPLPLPVLSDGPWCGAGGTQFDADLLRIRLIRITIRAETTSTALRGSGPLFVRPGVSRDARRYLPDVELGRFVSPRNMNLWQ